MSRVKKFQDDGLIDNMNDLASILDNYCYVMLNGRPCHPGFIVSMQYNVVRQLLRRGHIRRAAISHAWLDKNQERIPTLQEVSP